MRKDKPSRTAYKVAIGIVTLSLKPGMAEILPPGIVQATEQLLVASGAARAKTVRWAKSSRMLSVYQFFDRLLPGQFEALGYRKAFCERQAREAISAGAKQVLVLGAGYDTLSWRLAAEFPSINFFEIDHPATARLKAKGVEVIGSRKNLHLIAEDLGQRKLDDVLKSHSFWEQNEQTLIIAEGLIMYLPPEAVTEMFQQCSGAVGPGSRIAFSYIPSGVDGRPDVGRWTGLMLWLQKVAGEPWLWSIRQANLSSFLGALGWTCNQNTAEAAQKYGVEHIAVARK
jgi:methyltransferase (TIGR00027 family)